MNRFFTSGCMAIVALTSLGLFAAHHSPAVFDQTREITLSGTVGEFRWTNPHSWIDLSVNEDGESTPWAIEMTGPAHLVRAGWTRSTVRPGDRVTVVVNPLRTDEPVGKFVSIVLPDGRTLTERAQ